MDTLFVIRDSVVACVRNSSDLCQPSVKAGLTGISWQEVVALAIILFSAAIILWLLCKYQLIPRKKTDKKENEESKEAKKKEEQLAKLKDRLYNQLQSRVYIEKLDESGCKIKEYSKDNDDEYIERLSGDIKKIEDDLKSAGTKKTEEKSEK